jgi:putative membrane protein
METVPKLFNVLYPYMPMTYSVALFKQAITDTDTKAVLYNGGVLLAILIVFMALTILLSAIKGRRAEKAKVQMPVQFE